MPEKVRYTNVYHKSSQASSAVLTRWWQFAAGYRIAETFRGRNIHEFYGLRHPLKYSPQDLGKLYRPMIDFSIPRKFSQRNGHFLQIRESILPWKFILPHVLFNHCVSAITYCTIQEKRQDRVHQSLDNILNSARVLKSYLNKTRHVTHII